MPRKNTGCATPSLATRTLYGHFNDKKGPNVSPIFELICWNWISDKPQSFLWSGFRGEKSSLGRWFISTLTFSSFRQKPMIILTTTRYLKDFFISMIDLPWSWTLGRCCANCFGNIVICIDNFIINKDYKNINRRRKIIWNCSFAASFYISWLLFAAVWYIISLAHGIKYEDRNDGDNDNCEDKWYQMYYFFN